MSMAGPPRPGLSSRIPDEYPRGFLIPASGARFAGILSEGDGARFGFLLPGAAGGDAVIDGGGDGGGGGCGTLAMAT